MPVLLYFFVALGSFLVDSIPFVGPPAWMVMVFFQVNYHLNIWLVLVVGVLASAAGRLVYSLYIPLISNRFIKPAKNKDLQFIGSKLGANNWKVHLFVIVYTLVPLPSTPLFTAAGMARVKPINIIPSFIIGKFISDALMVNAGHFVAANMHDFLRGFMSWHSIIGTIVVLLVICVFLFIDWKTLLEHKKLKLSFNIWK